MCLRLVESDSDLAHVSGRVVRVFQRYAQNINPEDKVFLSFIIDYLAQKNIRDPKAIPYSELYGHVKDGIREYLRQQESHKNQKK